jgi:hypothetical protein
MPCKLVRVGAWNGLALSGRRTREIQYGGSYIGTKQMRGNSLEIAFAMDGRYGEKDDGGFTAGSLIASGAQADVRYEKMMVMVGCAVHREGKM